MNKKNKLISKTIFIVQIIIIILIIYCVINIFMWHVNNKSNEKIDDEISELITIEKEEPNSIFVENTEKEDTIENIEQQNSSDINSNDIYKIDFQKLKQINKNTVGYLKVNGTNIEYVVVQGKDNEYYLTHNFKNEKNSAGWIYADYNNQVDGNDKNLVIYGHNRRNGTMFSSLKNILNEDWYNNSENRKIIFVNENEQFIYEVFSIYQIKAEEYYTRTHFETEEEWNDFINIISSRTIKDFGINVNKDDKILTLSTCSNNNSYRIVLHAVKSKDNKRN